ncbi:MAG: TonB-dependent siderophore receptor [Porticoccaceae bacterium]
MSNISITFSSHLSVCFALAISFAPKAIAAKDTPSIVEEVIITALRADRKSHGATGLDLSLYQTPQGITIIDAQRASNFALDDINALLTMTTGVNVDATETDRTYYSARGFDITSKHIDGIGMPFGTLLVGDLDTVVYQQVEVIRGSNGLITGLGNPSGTINAVRKRPTNEFTAAINFSTGSWQHQRSEIDVSTPLTDSRSWAARAVIATQDQHSWLDHYENNRLVGSVTIDGQINERITLAAGYSLQDNNSDGVLWGAVPVIYANGNPAHYSVNTSTAMQWTYWDTQTEEQFVEVGMQLAQEWQLRLSAVKNDYQEDSELFYIYTNTGFDQESGLGLESFPGKYSVNKKNLLLDANLNGELSIFGREHQLQLGISTAKSDSESFEHAALTGFTSMPTFPGWNGTEVSRPSWDDPSQSAHEDIDLDRFYAAVQLNVSDQLQLIVGVNALEYTNQGVSYGVSTDADEDGSSPYYGVTYELSPGINFYASYSDIYQPQYVLGENLQSLGSAQGQSYEIGIKRQLHNGALFNLALFRTEQSNLQEFKEYGDGDGIDDTDYSDDFDFSIYRGVDVESSGIEVELSGQLNPQVSLQAGFTHLQMEDQDGEKARSFVPRNSFKLLLEYTPSALPDWKFGLSSRWQDDIYFDSSYGRISQPSYSVIGGYARYQFSPRLTFSANVDNLTDKQYFSSVKFEQAYYAAPRNWQLSVNWQY